MRTWTRLSTILATAGATLLATACGGGGSNPDSRVTDTNMNPDASAPDGSPDAVVQTRSATLAVSEVRLTDPSVAQLGLGGSSISFAFSDITKDGGTVVFGDSQPGNCLVVEYDGGATPTLKPNPLVDEGAITVAGAAVKKTTPPCTFVGGSYRCISAPTAVTAGSFATNNGQTLFSVTGTTFTNDQVGSYLSLSGFADAKLNNTFPIIGQNAGSLVLFTGFPTAASADFTAGGYSVIQGVGPVPGGAATVNYLDMGGSALDPVTISMAANADYPDGISASLPPIGKGMALDGPGPGCTDCAQPHQFPQDAANNNTVSFSVDDAVGDGTGTPGTDPSPVPGLTGIVISGVTTTGDLVDGQGNPLPPYAMPPAKEGTKYVTFTCSALLGKTRQLPHEVIAAVHATNPTRVETRVFRFAFSPIPANAAMNTANVLAGHGLIGHTTINPAAK